MKETSNEFMAVKLTLLAICLPLLKIPIVELCSVLLWFRLGVGHFQTVSADISFEDAGFDPPFEIGPS